MRGFGKYLIRIAIGETTVVHQIAAHTFVQDGSVFSQSRHWVDDRQ